MSHKLVGNINNGLIQYKNVHIVPVHNNSYLIVQWILKMHNLKRITIPYEQNT